MKRGFRLRLNRLRSNKGASQTIEFLIIIIILFMALTMVLDFGMYFINRNVYTTAAQNGARLAAIYGGAGPTPIAQKYGRTTITSECSMIGANDPVSCAVVQDLLNGNGTVASHITSVQCGPDETNRIGDRTWCEIHWYYEGVPGSLISSLINENVTRVSAESEVVTRN